NNVDRCKQLFDVTLRLLSSVQPPETATGSVLLQCFAQLPLDLSPIIEITSDHQTENNNLYWLIEHVRKRLEQEINFARVNLLNASAQGPMYGCLSGINALLSLFISEKSKTVNIDQWRLLFGNLILHGLDIAKITGPIVSASAPEGMFPMELTDCKNYLYFVGLVPMFDFIFIVSDNLNENDESSNVTSQMLLVCCWRTIKEISLLFSKIAQIGIPYIENEHNWLYVNIEQTQTICNYFMEQLLKSRHCGAFELAYQGFLIVCERLWSSMCPSLCQLPVEWIEDGLKMVQENSLYKDKLCLTRRSGGLPFYLQSILTNEPLTDNVQQQRKYVGKLMETLIEIIDNDSDTIGDDQQENSRKIHAYNTLRSFYRNTRFSNDVMPYVEQGLLISVRGFTSEIWMIRNCATLLLSAILLRIFGPARIKDDLSKKNSMTSREFFNKYPSLFKLFIEELNIGTSNPNESLSTRLFAILLILRRLYPSPLDGFDCTVTLDQLIPYVIKCQESPIFRIRENSSKALLGIIRRDLYGEAVSEQIQILSKHGRSIKQNKLHGALLQINGILLLMAKNNVDFTLTNMKDILEPLQWCIKENPCPLTQCCYLEFLYNLYKLHPNNNQLQTYLHQNTMHLLKSPPSPTRLAADQLTSVLTKVYLSIFNNENSELLFDYIKRTDTELSFVEILLQAPTKCLTLSVFQQNLIKYCCHMLTQMNLFNEQLYTSLCLLLSNINDEHYSPQEYAAVVYKIIHNMLKLRRTMSLSSSFTLIGKLLPLCTKTVNVEDVYARIFDYIDDDEEVDDELLCAILSLLKDAHGVLHSDSNYGMYCVDGTTDTVHTNGNEVSTVDCDLDLKCRRQWPSSDGYNNVFVSRNEDVDHYSLLYGDHLLDIIDQYLETYKDASSCLINDLHVYTQKVYDQSQELVGILRLAYEKLNYTNRSHIRLYLLIKYLKIMEKHGLCNTNVDMLVKTIPQYWLTKSLRNLLSLQ
ncbi:unnamed protein product, partial [Didymodactylos carnosus]